MTLEIVSLEGEHSLADTVVLLEVTSDREQRKEKSLAKQQHTMKSGSIMVNVGKSCGSL